MKKHVILSIVTFIVFGTVSFTYGQKLEVNKVDDFTNNTVKRTSWERITMNMGFTSYFRFSQINANNYFDLKLMLASGSVFAIDKNQKIMFKLDNGELVTLHNLEYVITCRGCGAKGYIGSDAQGIKTSYPIDKEQFEKIMNNTVVKIRIYTTDGYIENDIKEKNAKKISNALKLI